MNIWKQVFNNNHHALFDLNTFVYHNNWNKFYHYGIICGNTDHILFTGTIIAIIMISKSYTEKCVLNVLLNYMFSVLELIIITRK